jgi:hypothetical protein
VKSVLGKINGLRILIIENEDDEISYENQDYYKNITQLKTEILNSVKNLNYEELISINNKDNKIKFLSKEAIDDTLDNLLLSINTEKNTMLIMLDGKISMDDVNKLMNESGKYGNVKAPKNRMKNDSIIISEIRKTEKGDVISQTRKVESFNGIEISSGIKVNFTQGNTQNVRVETDSDKIEYIKTEVSGGVLKIYISNPRKISNLNFRKIFVDITAPKLNKIYASSGSNFTTINTINCDYFDVDATSGSNISVDISAKYNVGIEVTSGSSSRINVNSKTLTLSGNSGANITLTGNSDEANFNISSAATVNAQDLVTKNSTVNVSSASSLKVNASESLRGKVNSGGNVKYKGEPKLIEVNKSSGGNVKAF